jgi:hypothetical protein
MKQLMFLCILALPCVAARSAAGQTTPQFAATIYVEDAIGNVDSVVVGFDTLATTDMDEIFGEVAITGPFDAVLEVRAGTFLGFDRSKTSKVLIEPAEPVYPLSTSQGCYVGLPVFIYIWAAHQPVTIRWDKSQFLNDVCVRGSLLSNHWADEVTDPYNWWALPQNEYYCMGDEESWTIDLSAQAIEAAQVNVPVVIEQEVEGLGVQQVYGVRFFPSPTFTFWTPCSYITKAVDAQRGAREMRIFPNPASVHAAVKLPEGLRVEAVEIYDVQGQRVGQYSGLGAFDVSHLPPGMYLVLALASDGRFYRAQMAVI